MKTSMLIQGMLTEAMGMPLLILCKYIDTNQASRDAKVICTAWHLSAASLCCAGVC